MVTTNRYALTSDNFLGPGLLGIIVHGSLQRKANGASLKYPKGTINIQLEMSKIKKDLQLTGWTVSNTRLCAAMVSPH